jgi:hypothetical protein
MNLTIHNESPQDTFFQKIKFIYTAEAVGSTNHEYGNLDSEYGSKKNCNTYL